eukprot:363784-Chlamydomonas_euryale.AAC.7
MSAPSERAATLPWLAAHNWVVWFEGEISGRPRLPGESATDSCRAAVAPPSSFRPKARSRSPLGASRFAPPCQPPHEGLRTSSMKPSLDTPSAGKGGQARSDESSSGRHGTASSRGQATHPAAASRPADGGPRPSTTRNLHPPRPAPAPVRVSRRPWESVLRGVKRRAPACPPRQAATEATAGVGRSYGRDLRRLKRAAAPRSPTFPPS